MPGESGVITGSACVFPGLPGGLFRRFGTGLRRDASQACPTVTPEG